MWKTWLSFQSSSCSEYSDSEGYSQDVVWSFWYEPLVKEEEPIPRLCVVDEAGAKIETWVWYLHLKSWLSQFPTRRFTETVLMGFGISSAHTEYLDWAMWWSPYERSTQTAQKCWLNVTPTRPQNSGHWACTLLPPNKICNRGAFVP